MADKPLYIFDLDGTLALLEHRLHLIDKSKGNPDWQAFFAACDKDEPCWPVLITLNALRVAGAEVWVLSGRSDEVRDKTEAWLQRHLGYVPPLTMREAGDTRHDDLVKREMYDRMLEEDRRRLIAVFDDRDRVVALWRSLGIACFQVAPGDF